MITDAVILVTEDDGGHATLIKKNLRRGGISGEIIRFKDGQEVLDFLQRNGDGPHMQPRTPYILILDIRMPAVDGVEVLRRVKEDDELKRIPVIMVTTTDDPREVDLCHRLGCSNYIAKPVDYDRFATAIQQLGAFLQLVEVPPIIRTGKPIGREMKSCDDAEGVSDGTDAI
jgi:CheY-like chemotaxis protein